MDNTKYIALSRQMALWKQMDIVSNNMANMNTSGYKQDDAIFASYLTQTKNAEGFGRVPVYFTQDFGMYKDFKEGAIVHTGNTFDLALQGDAFFAIETPEGERYTRKGQFQLDADGQLVTSEGYAVMSENNEPFFIAPRARPKFRLRKTARSLPKTALSGGLRLFRLPTIRNF